MKNLNLTCSAMTWKHALSAIMGAVVILSLASCVSDNGPEAGSSASDNTNNADFSYGDKATDKATEDLNVTNYLAFGKVPVPISTVPFVYPPELKAAHLGGYVFFTLDIDIEGRVVGTRVENQNVDKRFADAATLSVSQWRFEKGIKNGVPVPYKVSQPIFFRPDPIPTSYSGRKDDGTYDVGHLDRPPRVIKTVSPSYPLNAEKQPIDGKVVVLIVLDQTGKVVYVIPIFASDKIFVKSAVKSVYRWEFEPGVINGVKTPCQLMLPIVFQTN